MPDDPRSESDRMIWVPVDPYIRRADRRRPALERRNELGLDRRDTAETDVAPELEQAAAGEEAVQTAAPQGAPERGAAGNGVQRAAPQRAPEPVRREGGAGVQRAVPHGAPEPERGAAGEGGQAARRPADGERRRVERRRLPAVPQDRTAGFLKRFRQPIIGVGLAGAALPMVASIEAPGSPSEEPEPGDVSASRTAIPAEDVEEALAERVGNERELEERRRIVEASVAEFGIARDMAEDIYDAAREEGIDPDVAFGLVRTESTFREDAKSHVGALGLTQVMPRTAAWLEPGTTSKDLYERETNLRLGFRYLDQMIEKYSGNVKLALLAYNRGPGTVDRVLERGGNPDNGYADKVLGR